MGEIPRKEWEELVDKVDKLTLSPSDRARKVWELLQTNGSFDTWDIICFCAWFLSYIIPEFPILEGYAKWLNVKVHQIHYQNGESLGLYSNNGLRSVDNSSKESIELPRNNSKK